LTAAECVRAKLGLDQVLFIPTGQPPHKECQNFGEHRYLMTLLATESNPHFKVSRMEMDRVGASYTVDTLRILKESYDEIHFIIGADEMQNLHTWKDAKLLPSLCQWVAVSRPGYHVEGTIKIPGVDISSTELRRRVDAGEPIKYLLPEAVERYIYEIGDLKVEDMHKAVAAAMSKKRYRHTLGVLEVAILLAARHGINMRQTYLAALFHDYAKELPDQEKRNLCKSFSITLDPIQDERISLMHGAISAELAKRDFGIDDSEVLSAIRYHTTGRAGMGKLEQLLKIADNIEVNRPDYLGLNDIRQSAKKDLALGASASIARDIQYTLDKGLEKIHPWGKEALAYLKGERSF